MSDPAREAVAALAQRVELDGVKYHAISGIEKEPPTDAEGATQDFDVMIGSDERSFGIRCRVRFDAPDAEYFVDASIRYVCEEPLAADDEVLRGFAERVGIMALYPYLRSAIHEMSSRLEVGRALMPIIRAGSIQLGREEASEPSSR